MKKLWLGIGLIALLVGTMFGIASAWRGSAGPSPYVETEAPMPNSTLATYYADLSQEEIDGLIYMVEEEKLARDVYLTLYDLWGVQVFSNIANSEERHMDAVLSLIEKYNLTAPETLDQVGVFQNEELQTLYDQLIETGSQSVVDALKVGALIEETDIKDLKEWIAKTDNEDIKTVYSNLMMGSENHLRAFVGQLDATGITYTAQVLPREQVDEILSAGKGPEYRGVTFMKFERMFNNKARSMRGDAPRMAKSGCDMMKKEGHGRMGHPCGCEEHRRYYGGR